MRERVCKNCGGRQYKVVGQNMVRCQFCGTLYVDEQASKEEEILLVSANEKLRDCKFDEAIFEFDKILSIYPNSFEAMYGKAQAKNKVIFYTNKRGSTKKPRFFGENIPDLLQDEDYIKAMESAPEEVAGEYRDNAKRVERVAKRYEDLDKSQKFDVVIYQMDVDNEQCKNKIHELVEQLKKKKIKTYFLQDLENKEQESDTFFALKSSKAFMLVANEKNGYNDSEVKNLIDRFRYFINERQKYSMGFVVALDEKVISQNDLPQELSFCKNYVDLNSKNFVHYAAATIQNIIEKTPQEVAKIETRKLEKAAPAKKEYVDVESVTPTELGYYKIENVDTSDVIKTKWIFLSLKNADFESTKETIKEELAKDPNNAEMLFAQMLCEKKLRTAGEFFSNIDNFDDQEKIDKILQYSTKEFAEMFVDNWENLIERLQDKDEYNDFLLYLVKFDTPNREHFIDCAQEIAIKTLDEDLIEKVVKCFKSDQVDRFVKFYFSLAQQSDNPKYYDKILEIDQGHKQSNIAVLLRNFKTNQDKLEFRDRTVIEESLKFLDENARKQFASSVIDSVIPIAFLDLKKAEEQIDFYLSYISEKDYEIPLKISNEFLQINFFKQAEKYITLAISRNKKDAALYWELLKIKAHCRNETEVVTSPIDLTKYPEWRTLLSYADDKQTEYYAEIVSRSHLYKGKKKKTQAELWDKEIMIEKLSDFINRNNNILLEAEKENGVIAKKGCEYYKLQLMPFENYLDTIKQTENLEDYLEVSKRIYHRLYFLDLTFDSSISTLKIHEKGEGLKNVNMERVYKEEKPRRKVEKDKDHKKFWKWFCVAFFEFVPVTFLAILLSISLADPKLVYAYFSQRFVLSMLIYSVIVAFANMIYYIIKKKNLTFKLKFPLILIMIIAFSNVILTATGLYLTTNSIAILNSKEFEIFARNATYSDLVLENDIDMSGINLQLGDFYGSINGKNHTISNLTLKDGENISIFKSNFGKIFNLKINLKEKTYKNVSRFSVIALKNYGDIENVSINGSLTIEGKGDFEYGAFACSLCDGVISNSSDGIAVIFKLKGGSATIGKICGRVIGNARMVKTYSTGSVSFKNLNNNEVCFGGLVGKIYGLDKYEFSRNHTELSIEVLGNTKNLIIGGLFGVSEEESKNNYSNIEVSISGVITKGFVGGLYGKYTNANRMSFVEYSYSRMTVVSEAGVQIGGLVGGECGSVQYCYTDNDYDLCGSVINSTYGCNSSCKKNVSGYEKIMGFSSSIWNGVGFNSSEFPTLK